MTVFFFATMFFGILAGVVLLGEPFDLNLLWGIIFVATDIPLSVVRAGSGAPNRPLLPHRNIAFLLSIGLVPVHLATQTTGSVTCARCLRYLPCVMMRAILWRAGACRPGKRPEAGRLVQLIGRGPRRAWLGAPSNQQKCGYSANRHLDIHIAMNNNHGGLIMRFVPTPTCLCHLICVILDFIRF
ncbi:MAG: hypothetical protein GVY24_00365 [Planctomycetes bacterium]|nr:hypothetical protein [Planctomycetota bacterium]